MKKIFLYPVVLLIPLTLMLTVSHAQKRAADPRFNKNMKVAEDSAVSNAASASYSSDLSALNSKVSKNFTKNFKNAADLRISTYGSNTYIYCITDGIMNRIRYDKKGNWNYTIRYYLEDRLPADIRKQVKSNYYDFDIAGVTEVNVGDKTAYLVRIKSSEEWKTVKIVDDEMIITESFRIR